VKVVEIKSLLSITLPIYHYGCGSKPAIGIEQAAMISSPAFSVLDLAPVRQGGSIADTFRNSLDLARHAEDWGYTRFWMAEHHNMPGIASAATSVLIGFIAAGTKTIRVGSGGIMLPNHSSLVIAEQFGTLATLFPGRIDLGLGRAPGTDGLTARALRRHMNQAVDFPEQVTELLGYLGSATQSVRAVPGLGTNVPVWLLGSSTFSAQLAADLGLPFAFAAHFAPQEMMDAISIYRRYFEPSQYARQPYVVVGLPVVAADSDEEAQYLSTTSSQRFLKLIRGEPFLLEPPVRSMDGLWSAPEKELVASRFQAAIVGGPGTVRRKLEDFVERTQADEIIFQCEPYDHQARLHSFEITAEVMKSLVAEPVRG
jgi:luciferase family oxidoreductase group 1